MLKRRLWIPSFVATFLFVALCAASAEAQSIFTGGGTEEGRPATGAALNEPISVALDSAGNLYIGERMNYRVRRVDTATSIITLLAGNGLRGFSGDGGAAREARITDPHGLAVEERRKDRTNVLCVATVESGAAVISAVGITTDNRTGYLKHVVFSPTGGVPATGVLKISLVTAKSATPTPPQPVAGPRKRSVRH